MCTAAGFNATCEVSISGRCRPADILLPHWQGGGPCAIDVSVVRPLASSVHAHTVKTGREAVDASAHLARSQNVQALAEGMCNVWWDHLEKVQDSTYTGALQQSEVDLRVIQLCHLSTNATALSNFPDSTGCTYWALPMGPPRNSKPSELTGRHGGAQRETCQRE